MVEVEIVTPPHNHHCSELVVFGYDIDDAPTIDAVPVVRCRECKYYNRALQLCNNGLGTRLFEFYCADGKKMDGGADDV